MASPLLHAAVGYAVFRVASPRFLESNASAWKRLGFLATVIWLSVLPDFDAVPGIVAGDLGSYHNQLTHSLFMGLAVGVASGVAGRLVSGAGFGRWLLLGLACYTLHVLMDFFTIGRGVQLFWPLTPQRYLSPIPLFYGLSWASGLWSRQHIVTLANEVPIAAALIWLMRRTEKLWKN